MEEVWKDIAGYEGLYQVSNLGRVRSLDRNVDYGFTNAYRKGKILKAGKATCGYLQVGLNVNKVIKHALVHRLVAEAFIPNNNNLPEVNHKDENKENNTVENLEWCNRVNNINYGTGIERSAKKRSIAVVMCDLDDAEIEVFCSVNEAARKTGTSAGNICMCCKGIRETANGYKWKYE